MRYITSPQACASSAVKQSARTRIAEVFLPNAFMVVLLAADLPRGWLLVRVHGPMFGARLVARVGVGHAQLKQRSRQYYFPAPLSSLIRELTAAITGSAVMARNMGSDQFSDDASRSSEAIRRSGCGLGSRGLFISCCFRIPIKRVWSPKGKA